MSLESYHLSRVVALSAHATAYDAVRAMESNHVGAVIIQEQGKLVGIVTDRDLALRVIGYELNPVETQLADVMTPRPAWVSVDDSEEEALALMRDRHCRRLPVVGNDERVVGMLTLDDMILSLRAAPQVLAEIVRSQLAEPARLKPAGLTHPQRVSRATPGEEPGGLETRHRVHAEQTYREFLHELKRATGLESEERALTAFEVVAFAIARRITSAEAADFAAQLPSVLRERILELPRGPNREITRDSIEAEMARRLDLDRGEAAELVTRVGGALSNFVSTGELEDIDAQLPLELKGLVRPSL